VFIINLICNKFIWSGIFPDHLKFSILKPIYKKGNRMNPANYRPISLLASFFKVFVKTLYIRLTEHIYSNKLLVGNQFGFRKCIASEDAIFKLTNEVSNFRCQGITQKKEQNIHNMVKV